LRSQTILASKNAKNKITTNICFIYLYWRLSNDRLNQENSQARNVSALNAPGNPNTMFQFSHKFN
jgi:hypothetical protein